MKYRAPMLFISILLCVFFCNTAFATEPQYKNTIAFSKLLDDADINYTVIGIDDDGDEKVTIKNNDDNGQSYTIRYFFRSDNEYVGIRVWNIIDFKESDFSKMLRVVNTLNEKYKYARFSLDENDNSLSLSFDLILRPSSDAGDIIIEATLRVVQILEVAYETYSVYAK